MGPVRKPWVSPMIQVVEFRVDGVDYAFETDRVEEVIEAMPATRLPLAKDWIDGLVNLRGNIVVLANVRRLLNLSPSSDYGKLIVVRSGDSRLGLMVDEVLGVQDLAPEEIQKAAEAGESEDLDKAMVSGVRAAGSRVVNHLDLERFLDTRS